MERKIRGAAGKSSQPSKTARGKQLVNRKRKSPSGNVGETSLSVKTTKGEEISATMEESPKPMKISNAETSDSTGKLSQSGDTESRIVSSNMGTKSLQPTETGKRKYVPATVGESSHSQSVKSRGGKASDLSKAVGDVFQPAETHKKTKGKKSAKVPLICTEDCNPGKNSLCPIKSKNRGKAANNKSCVEVHDLLKKMGIIDPEKKSRCVKAAIQRGHIKVKGMPEDLEMVVASLPADRSDCGHGAKATLRDLLEQQDYGGNDYEDQEEAPVKCQVEDCEWKWYVTEICSGDFRFDSGKFHNHCSECPGFGTCVGDYRNAHCFDCGRHYFDGIWGQGKCYCKTQKKQKKRTAVLKELLSHPVAEQGLDPFQVLSLALNAVRDSDSDSDDGW